MKSKPKPHTPSAVGLCLTTSWMIFSSASVSEGQTNGGSTTPAAPQTAEVSKSSPAGTVDEIGTKLSATAAQSDGRLIVAGKIIIVGEAIHRNLARLNTDGTVDRTFTANTDGEVKTLSVQEDDEILISGSFTKINDTAVTIAFEGSAIARLDRNGNLPQTVDDINTQLNATAAQSNGKSIIAGKIIIVGEALHRNLVRLNTDGTVDRTFTGNTDGEVKTVSV